MLEMSFLEPLPNNCPPPGAQLVSSNRGVFRLVRNNPPIQDDFRSQRAERPSASFSVTECEARGLSVFEQQADCEKIRKLPRFLGSHICVVQLRTGAGHIQQTFKPSHHTWWPFADYNILGNSQVQRP